MQTALQTSPRNWVTALRGFVGGERAAAERCELCHTEIDPEHAHLIEPETRRILCACLPCSLLFDSSAARHYRRIPRRASRFDDFTLSDPQWEAFLIPINMAFFFHSSPQGRILALYPGPAGATESTLDLDAWEDLTTVNPELRQLEVDVEALLVNRVAGSREYYRVPIDRCFELVGLIRNHWRGLAGGEEAQNAIRDFFNALRHETARA